MLAASSVDCTLINIDKTMDELTQNLLNYKAILFVALLVGFFLLERWRPELRQSISKINLRRWARNYGLLLVNTVLSATIVIPLTIFAADLLPNWRSSWQIPLALELLVDIVMLDLFMYCWHRINHEIPLLWRFHKVHHLDETLDSSSAVRFHFIEVLLSALLRAAVMVALDINFLSIVVFELLFAISVIYQHSNTEFSNRAEKLLAFLIITPKLHWTHHHQSLPYTNSNYGSVLSVWDRIFKSRYEMPAASRKELPIGLDNHRDDSLIELLLKPIAPKKRG